MGMGSSFISTRSSMVERAGEIRAAIISVARTMVRLRSFDIDVTGRAHDSGWI